ncbi:LPXTG cell wall anchor domain-containing protein [Fluviicola sp.]
MINGFLLIAAAVTDPETDTSILWYILPTSGFALLLSLYFIIKRRRKK